MIYGSAVTQMNVVYYSKLFKGIEGAIDGRKVHVWILMLHNIEEIVSGDV